MPHSRRKPAVLTEPPTSGARDIAAANRNSRLFVTNPRQLRHAVPDRLLARHREAKTQAVARIVSTDRPFGAWIKNDSRLCGRLDQRPYVDLRRQLDPEKDAAFRCPAFRRRSEFPRHGFRHGSKLLSQHPIQMAQVTIEVL